MNKENLRTNKITVWWRWWDEAEHKSTPEKRLAFYDALFRYAFRGDTPEDPMETGNEEGEVWAAYDATHHFDVIDNEIAPPKQRGGQPGNQNASKRRNESNESKNEYENESKNEELKDKNECFINYKDIKNKIIKKERDISGGNPPRSLLKKEAKELFEKFWSEYPSSCPRKYDKRKCLAKWESVFRPAKDAPALFAAVMDGLAKWKRSAMWNEADGRYIKAPLVWLNGSCWEDAPREEAGGADGSGAVRRELEAREAEMMAGLRRKGMAT